MLGFLCYFLRFSSSWYADCMNMIQQERETPHSRSLLRISGSTPCRRPTSPRWFSWVGGVPDSRLDCGWLMGTCVLDFLVSLVWLVLKGVHRTPTVWGPHFVGDKPVCIFVNPLKRAQLSNDGPRFGCKLSDKRYKTVAALSPATSRLLLFCGADQTSEPMYRTNTPTLPCVVCVLSLSGE